MVRSQIGRHATVEWIEHSPRVVAGMEGRLRQRATAPPSRSASVLPGPALPSEPSEPARADLTSCHASERPVTVLPGPAPPSEPSEPACADLTSRHASERPASVVPGPSEPSEPARADLTSHHASEHPEDHADPVLPPVSPRPGSVAPPPTSSPAQRSPVLRVSPLASASLEPSALPEKQSSSSPGVPRPATTMAGTPVSRRSVRRALPLSPPPIQQDVAPLPPVVRLSIRAACLTLTSGVLGRAPCSPCCPKAWSFARGSGGRKA
jgi:hypothetical protein